MNRMDKIMLLALIIIKNALISRKLNSFLFELVIAIYNLSLKILKILNILN